MPSFIEIFGSIGGGLGVAALISQYIAHRSTKSAIIVAEKSVAIDEIERIIPGMGEIISEWRAMVGQLQTENEHLREEISALRDEIDRLRKELRR